MDGVACISRRKVYYCVGRFEGGQTLTVDDVGPGRPSTATCIEVKEHIDQRVQAQRAYRQLNHSLAYNTLSWKFDIPTIKIHYPTRSIHIRFLNDYVHKIQLKCPLFQKLNKEPTN